jgi:hypothetical protein
MRAGVTMVAEAEADAGLTLASDKTDLNCFCLWNLPGVVLNAPLEQALVMEKSVALLATVVAAATIFPLLFYYHQNDNGNTAATNFIAQ